MLDSPGMIRILTAFRDRIVNVKVDPASPWLSVTVEPAWGEEATAENAERNFAVWQATDQVYDVDDKGAVHDDPIPPGTNLKEVR